jgi:hypothetical protein
MDRGLVANFERAAACGVVQRPDELQGALNLVDLALLLPQFAQSP